MLTRHVSRFLGASTTRVHVLLGTSTRRAGGARCLGAASAALATGSALAAACSADCMSLGEWWDQDQNVVTKRVLGPFDDPSSEWVRVDRLFLNGDLGERHVIFDTLGAKTNVVPLYRIYAKRDGSEITGVATLAEGSEGHRGIVHGGVTALIFDNTLGWTNALGILADLGELDSAFAGKPIGGETTQKFGFTASLTVNYRAPCRPGMNVVFTCRVVKTEGRKRWLKGEAHDAATGTLVADVSSLFVVPRAS